jgi:alkanesulfonate monooxygenase SsuD/methylene tetrahydromethanopterin reductase-like flavin-dependent oxidoreductase (luciferase family)
VLTLRFDMRAPAFGAATTDLYATALDMCSWAESRGAFMAVLSEHHGTDDNHLPAPMLMASAIAARTERMAVLLAALVLPLRDPVRLAEEIAVLDIVSKGRVAYVFGVGHRTDEYEHFGLEANQRGKVADANLALLLRLLGGDAVVEDGRRIHVTPSPISPSGPRFLIGGGSLAAARRAGRFGLDLLAQADRPGLREAYEEACRESHHPVGRVQLPDRTAATAIFVADDLDAAWEELGPHLLHDAVTAASYRERDDAVASISRARTVDELRASGGAYRILTPHEATELVGQGRTLPLLPLCAGLAPEVAWPYLERALAVVADARSTNA